MDFTEAQLHRYARHIILPEVGGEGQARLLQAKVLVVGEAQVGKTSLIKQLLELGDFDPVESQTHGIITHRWDLPLAERTVRLNMWDFGGQEIMHATHQFFLTKRSLYLLVLDSRQNERQSRIDSS